MHIFLTSRNHSEPVSEFFEDEPANDEPSEPESTESEPESTEDVIAQAGEDVSFSVEADGGKKPYRYQWQVWDKITRKWVDQPGFTGPTLSWKNVDKNRDGWKIRCVVTDAEGTKIISREATLHVWSDVPTGDSSNLPMYLTIAALALAAMVILWRKRRKV